VGAIVVGDGVGSDLSAVVPETSGGDPGSAEVASSPLVQSGDDSLGIWVVGTALVLAALAGAFVVAMRNRRKAPVAG